MLKLPNYTAIAYQCKVYYLFFGSVNWVVAPAGPATCPSTNRTSSPVVCALLLLKQANIIIEQ